jgi:polysaccharide lyase-like protein
VLIGALAAGFLLASPAWGAAPCGNPGYSYAGLLASQRVHGISASISAPLTPTVQSGDVSAWVGVGRAGVAGKRGSIRAGLLASAGSPPQLFFEARRAATGEWVRFLGPQVAPGEAHRISIRENPRVPGYWRVRMDGRTVSGPIRLRRQARGKRALATAESWDGGAPTCNQFSFRFGPVKVRRSGGWYRLAARRVLEDPGYAVVRQPLARFVAKNAPDGSNFFGNWETGDSSQWSGNHWNQAYPLSEQFQIVTDPVRQGNYAAKFVVRPGDEFSATSGERSEVLWSGSDESDGQDHWYSWSTLFPTDWSEPKGWGIFLQWHADYSTTPPVISFNAREDYAWVVLNAGPLSDPCCGGSTRERWTILPTLDKGLWHDFIAHIKWSGGNDGAITVWHRLEGQDSYVKVLDVSGVPTLQSQNGVPAKNYVKMGLYRDHDTKTNTIYHDGFHRWTSPDPPPEVASAL